MDMDYAKLVEGQEVAVSRPGTWHIHNEGTYKVIKTNKLKVVLQRVSDGYTREFSVKRKAELGRFESRVWNRSFIESIEDMKRRQAVYTAERDLKSLWSKVEDAARSKDLASVKELVSKIEQLAA